MATANMLLTLPTVGVTAGPAYASQINAALEVVDRHDHSTGSGVQITPAGLNINADLSFNENDATDLRTARFTSQPSALTGASPDLACLYVVADDLYYNDGAGNQIALTIGGSIAGATGNITGLVAPAAVTYTSGGSPNYKFISTATESANIDAASYLMRNPGVTATYALTLQAPTLSNNYSITLPALPGAASFLQIDSSGVITAAPAVALGITAANLAADSVTTAKILNLNVTNDKIANSTITAAKLAFAPTLTRTVYNSTNASIIVPAGMVAVHVEGIGSGGGGGGGGQNTSGQPQTGGGGGASGAYGQVIMPVVAGETLSVTINSGGAGGNGAASGSGTNGSAGGNTVVSAATSGWTLTFSGGAGGVVGAYLAASGGTGAPGIYSAGLASSAGANGGTGVLVAGSAGTASAFASGGAGGSAGPSGSGGGGGGAGVAAGGAGGAGGPSAGTAAAANSGAGGGGGGGSTGVGAGNGGAGGSGRAALTFVPLA